MSVIEYSDMTPDAASIAVRLRNAPQWVRDDIDRKRSRRGDTAVPWGPMQSRVESTAPGRKFRTSQPARHALYHLVATFGGVSSPCAHRGDGETLPEMVDFTVLESWAKSITEGRSVPLLDGHHGKQFGTIDKRHATVTVNRVAGLTFRSQLFDEPPHQGEGLGLSPQFLSKAISHRNVGGRRVRVITSADLKHFALLPKRKGGAYGMSVVRTYPTTKSLEALAESRRQPAMMFQAIADAGWQWW